MFSHHWPRRAGRCRRPALDVHAMPHAQAGAPATSLPLPAAVGAEADPRDGIYSLLAEWEGEVAGALVLMVEPAPRRRHVASIGMAVHDDWAGRGVGTALMQAALDLADNWLGLTRVELTVWADNQAALALYRKAGFVEEGVARDYGLRHGVLVDALYMARVRR